MIVNFSHVGSRSERRATRTATPWWAAPSLSRQHFLEERERAGIARLAEPEHRLLAHLRVAVRLRHLDEHGHALFLRELAEGEDGLLLDLRLRVVRDGAGDGGD